MLMFFFHPEESYPCIIFSFSLMSFILIQISSLLSLFQSLFFFFRNPLSSSVFITNIASLMHPPFPMLV